MADILKRPRESRPVRYIIQLVALVDRAMGARVDRLVRATRLSMAELLRQALDSGLPSLESYYHAELDLYDLRVAVEAEHPEWREDLVLTEVEARMVARTQRARGGRRAKVSA